jgi:epoxyqueuosine reductase
MIGREERILEEARSAGFPLAGCAPLTSVPRAEFLAGWLAQGRAGDMAYLSRRTAERLDPRVLARWARSIIVLGSPYRPPPPPPRNWQHTLRGRIAAYAAGGDYHREIRGRLARLAVRLKAAFPTARFRGSVDTGAVLEREWGMRAGLGWIGRNTLLLHRAGGSYFFLGELFTDLTLDALPLPADHCGSCTRCLTACPTGALEDYAMDPRRCISYLTIEHRGAIPVALRPALENWIFGCDLCQEVCPWNGDARDPADADALAPHLPDLLTLDDAGFDARFAGTVLARSKRRGLLRNVAVALGNSGNPAAIPTLAGALGDLEPLVRGHAAWALGRLGGPAAVHALDAARRRETDPDVAAELAAARAAC